jgi:hypothetical protein
MMADNMATEPTEKHGKKQYPFNNIFVFFHYVAAARIIPVRLSHRAEFAGMQVRRVEQWQHRTDGAIQAARQESLRQLSARPGPVLSCRFSGPAVPVITRCSFFLLPSVCAFLPLRLPFLCHDCVVLLPDLVDVNNRFRELHP